MKNNFSLFEPEWSATDETCLLDSIVDCGLGNWLDVAHQMRTKNRRECEQHYMKYYVDNSKPPLPVMEQQDLYYQAVPIVYKLCEDPPRPAENSPMQIEMAGYMPARGDFQTEHSNYAEHDIKDIEFTDSDNELETSLNLTVLEIYQRCLKERHRRKRIIKEYGLINYKKTSRVEIRYEKAIGSRISNLRTLMRLLKPEEFEKYMEALCYESTLKADIKRLKEYQEAGITKLHSIRVYNILKRRREEEKRKRHMLDDLLTHLQDETACQQWLHRQAVLDSISKGLPVPLPSAPRKIAPPLEINGLPGIDKLCAKERELCMSVRLVPESYIEFRKLLTTECAKQGYLRLAQARSMIKIDVNKTRKIFDFLVSEGILNKSPSSKHVS